MLTKRVPHINGRLRLLTQGLNLLQLLSFLAASNLNWGSLPSVAWLKWISSFIAVNGLSFLGSAVVSAALFYTALVWAAVFCLLFACKLGPSERTNTSAAFSQACSLICSQLHTSTRRHLTTPFFLIQRTVDVQTRSSASSLATGQHCGR